MAVFAVTRIYQGKNENAIRNTAREIQFMKIGEEHFVDSVLIPNDAKILGSTYQLEVLFVWYDTLVFAILTLHIVVQFNHVVFGAMNKEYSKLLAYLLYKLCVCAAHRIKWISASHHNSLSTSKHEQWPKKNDSLNKFFIHFSVSIFCFRWIKCLVVNPVRAVLIISVETFDYCCRADLND